MRGWLRACRQWWLRHSRFLDELRFRRDLMEAELEELGFRPDEARALARHRHSTPSLIRRSILQKIGRLPDLTSVPLVRRLVRSPYTLPSVLLFVTILALAIRPGRAQLAMSIVDDLTPSTWFPIPRRPPVIRYALVPTGFATDFWALVLALGFLRISAAFLYFRINYRVYFYGVTGLTIMSVFAVTVWARAMQLWSVATWRSDFVQGVVGIALMFSFAWLTLAAARFWWHDLARRCPSCLQLLRMPLERGVRHAVLFDPAEIETVCLQGHGALTENRWQTTFHGGRSFWDDLRGTAANGHRS